MYSLEASRFVPFGMCCAFPTAALHPAQSYTTPQMGLNPLDFSSLNLQALNVSPPQQSSPFTNEFPYLSNMLNTLQTLHIRSLLPYALHLLMLPNVAHALWQETQLRLLQTHGNVGSALGYQEASPYQVILAPYNFEGGQQILPHRFYGVLPQPTLGSISYENALPSLLQHDYSYSAHSQHTSELNYANVAQHCLPQPQSSFSTVHLTEQELPPTLWQVNETFCSSHEAQTASEVCPCVRCQALFPFACGTEDIQQPTFPHGTNVPVFTAPDNGLFLHPQDQEVVHHSAEQETVVLDYRMDVHESQSHTDLPCTLRNQRRFSASDAPVADRRIPGRMRLNSEPVHIEILEDTLFFVKNTSASIRTYASPNLNEWGIKHPRGIIFQSEKSIVCCFFFESGVRCYARLTPLGIKFSTNLQGVSYFLDEAGVRTRWGSHMPAEAILKMWNRKMRNTPEWQLTTGNNYGVSFCLQKEGFTFFSTTSELNNLRMSVKDSCIRAKSGRSNPNKPDFIYLKTYSFRSSERFKQNLHCDGSSLRLTFHSQTAYLDSSGQLSLHPC